MPSRKKVNGPVPKGMSTGLVPRNFKKHPPGYLDFAPVYPASELIDPSEWADRLAENRKNKAGLLELRQANLEVLKSLNQNGLGLCWAFSSTKAVMYCRALQNSVGLRLSAWYVAGMIKKWRDEGGWGAASLEFIVSNGVPAESYCPSYSSKYATADTAANAALHKVTQWWDGPDDSSAAQKILVSTLLRGRPAVVDLNVMSHSMCAIDIESLNPLTIIYDNSWGTNGDPDGFYRGKGAYAMPNGLVIPRVTLPSPK